MKRSRYSALWSLRWGSSNQSRERNLRTGRPLSEVMEFSSLHPYLLVSWRDRGRRRRGLAQGLYGRGNHRQLWNVGVRRERGEEEACLRHVLGLEGGVADLLRRRLGPVVQNRGVNDAWQDGGEAHAVRVFLEAGGMPEFDHARLRGLVGGTGGVGPTSGDAGDQDDQPSRGPQVRQRGPYGVEGAAEVHRDHGVPPVGRQLLQPPLRKVHPRRHDEHVHPAIIPDLLDEMPDVVSVRDVERVRRNAATTYALFYGLPATGRGVNPGVRVGEEVGGGEPDAAASPYDERRFAGQVRAFHYSASARKTLICSDGPRTSSANAPGPSSSDNTGGNSPMPALPSTSQSSACS